MRPKYSLLIAGIVAGMFLLAQNKQQVSAIDQAIADKNYGRADSLIDAGIKSFIAVGDIDTLIHFLPQKAQISLEQSGIEKATSTINHYLDFLISKTSDPRTLSDAYREAAIFYTENAKDELGYNAYLNARTYAGKLTTDRQKTLARIEYNLNTLADHLGKPGVARVHQQTALALLNEIPDPDQKDVYLICNGIGSGYWYASKYDSALLYYGMALTAVKKMPSNALNKYYRPGNIENNIAAIYSARGETSAAIQAMLNAIENFQAYIADKDPEPKRSDAGKALFEGIDNLAGIYKEIGDYGRAGELLNYSYQQKKAKLGADHPGIFISEILLGQHYVSIRQYEIALQFLNAGLDKLHKANGDYLFWEGDATYNLAMAQFSTKDMINAAANYEKAERIYDEAYGGQYDNVYMDFMRNAASFYAIQNDFPRALQKANKIYTYLQTVGEATGLQGFYQLLNIADVHYRTQHFGGAIDYARKAITVIDNQMKPGIPLLDSLKLQAFKPRAILIESKAEYSLQTKRDVPYLSSLSERLKAALYIVEHRKEMLDDAESINVLISDNAELINFAKQVELELYTLTNDEARLNQFINLHESALYNRIRSRLDKQNAISFTGLPKNLQQEELTLKAAIPASLRSDKSNTELLTAYVSATNAWKGHLDKIKKEYPVYYNMRYASIFKSIPQLQAVLPRTTTLVRYYEVDSNLYVLVVDSMQRKLIHLDNGGIDTMIIALLEGNNNATPKGDVIKTLYERLWLPFADLVRNENVIIIPDGSLMNLSFEMLSPVAVTSYRELAKESLLAKHTISYHYSLFMIGNGMGAMDSKENYVAFAPGFSDEIKKQYQSRVKDSVKLDYQYLSLLPQPNTNKLARKIIKEFGGSIFLDAASTRSSFRSNAGGHRIIHIGTHAEYNNINPEKSRLIFAKQDGNNGDSNSLYLPDIYNCNVQSALTVLTACESGRPGYQDGEGMVSLAHAFNYAGSKSILTGLWQIDEQSSTQITETFFAALRKGEPTAKALKQAKLAYLSIADGRQLAPAYWAGLVLLGESAVIRLEENNSSLPWIIAGVCLVAVLGGGYWVRRRRMKAS